MSFATHARQNGRTPCVVVEVDLDWIDDVAVTATNSDGTLCYRTPATTKITTYPVVTKTRRWMTKDLRAIPTLGAIPCVTKATIASEEIRIGRGLGFFGQVSIELADFYDDDRREDPFYSDASRDAIDRSAGSYFGRLIARNPYWTNRPIRVIEGWATNGVWSAEDSITHHFLVRDIQGPSGNRVTITAAGPLQLLNLTEQEVPAPSRGALAANITAGATAATISPVERADEYGAAGMIRIGDEVVEYTRTGASLTLVRGAQRTVAESHTAGDTLQDCFFTTAEPLTDVLSRVLQSVGVDPDYLALDEWAEEQASWLALYLLTAVISKPTKVLDVVQELLEAAAAMVWWDDNTAKVRLRAIRPALASLGAWSDRFHFTAPVMVKRDLGERASRSDMLIDLRDAAQDAKDAASYRIRVVGEQQGEGPTEHGSASVKLMFSRWISAGQVGLAVRACAQSTMILRDGRQTFVGTVAAKDASREIGDIIDITTRELVDRNGQPIPTRVVVTKREPVQYGTIYRYTLERVPFDGRFAFYTDTDCPDYDSASTRQRDPGGFYSNAAGDDFGPSDPAYLYG